MDTALAVAYLATLVAMLAGLGWLIARQVLKNRNLEAILSDLQPKLQKEKGTPEQHYQLGSVYLRKKLYAKAISEFQKTIKEGGEDMAEVYNALGYAYFSQQQFDLAIKNYKEAIERKPDYAIALNNLGHAYEKKKLTPQALEMYEKALAIDPKNATAQRRFDSLRKRMTSSKP